MSEQVLEVNDTRPLWRDYLEMCKPKVVALMMLTTIVGMLLAVPGAIPFEALVYGNLGIALCAGSAAAINHLVDRRIDIQMSRTEKRPMAQGRIEPLQALSFALLLGVTGMLMLAYLVNPLTAWLTLASLIGYAFIYTLFLKRATPQNIVIGGLAGAAPPLLGWVAVTNSLDPNSLLLVLIIFAWTPPHFWALALHRQAEYAKVDIPMLPVTHGDSYTRLHTLLYSIIMFLVALMPYFAGMSGYIYLAGASILGARFVQWSWWLYQKREDRAPMGMFKYSIIYLMLLFVVLLVDHYWLYGVLV